jgi:hypothetical protein
MWGCMGEAIFAGGMLVSLRHSMHLAPRCPPVTPLPPAAPLQIIKAVNDMPLDVVCALGLRFLDNPTAPAGAVYCWQPRCAS